MQHISRKELYTNLEARVQYLHSFLDFSSNDIEALILGGKYIRALIPAVVNIVYKKLLQYDITARAFETRSTSYEGPLTGDLNENSPQILHRKMFLRGYLQKLCSDPSKMEFWEYFDKVGMMHVGQGRVHPLHVEYIHIGICLAFMQDVLTEALLSHPRLKMDRKVALVKAVNKVLWIQNDLFAKWYTRDGEEYREDMKKPEIEKEGYLHGKKMIIEGSDVDDTTSETSESTGPSAAGGNGVAGPREGSGCPFAGLTKGVEGMNMEQAHAQNGVEVGEKGESAESTSKSPRPQSGSGIPRPIGLAS